MEQLTKIKKDAVIDAKIGSGMLKRLHEVLYYFSTNLNEETSQKYIDETKAIAENPSIKYSEPWMGPLLTISLLITELEKKAIEQGHTYTEDIEGKSAEDLLKDLI